MSTRNESPGRDQGSALIMAIVFVTVIGVAMAAGLGYAAATIRAQSTAYAPARDKLYVADAAIKATAQYVAQNPSAGRWTLDGSCKTATIFGTVRDEDVTTVVCPQRNSFVGSNRRSDWGLRTLATGLEKGLLLSGQGGIQVNGEVAVNSAIDVGSNSVLAVVGGTVKALGGGCSTARVTVDGVGVAACTVASAPAADPGYTPGVSAAPAAAVGSCDSASSIATLGAGTWTQSAFTTALGSCSYVWMKPGLHHLDSIDWTIKNKIVAGTLTGSLASIKTSALGAGCVQSSNGAMLVLGGTTKIGLSGSISSFEVCGMTTTQGGRSIEIPLFGPTSDIFTPSTVSMSTTIPPTGTNWSAPDRARAVDGTVATFTLPRNTSSNALTLSGFRGSSAIPATVTSLSAVVRGVSSTAATMSIVVRNSGESTNACTTASAQALPVGGSVSSSTNVTLTLTCTKALVAPLTLLLTAAAPNSGDTREVQIDGVALSYVDNGGTIRAQSGCVAQVSGCAVLASNGAGNSVWLDGEVYLPKAKISVQIPNSSLALSTLGMVVRVLDVQTTGSTVITPIVATENGVGGNGDVTVKVTVGVDVWITCRVAYTGAAGSYKATIKGCTVPR